MVSASWSPSEESLCALYKSFLRPILIYASPSWFPFSSPILYTSVEKMERSSFRVITGCLSSTRISLLHLQALLPHFVSPLLINLSLTSNGFSDYPHLFLQPLLLVIILAPISKKDHGDPYLYSFRNLTSNLQLLLGPLILCPPKPPWSTLSSYSISYQLSCLCSRNEPPFLQDPAAVSHLFTFPHSDITAWTDGSIPGGLGEGDARIHIKCTKCLNAFLLGWMLSHQLQHRDHSSSLKWCISHSSSRVFECITLFSDSQSLLTTTLPPCHTYYLSPSLTPNLFSILYPALN